MNKEQIEQAAKVYADKEHPFEWPLNKHGEPIRQLVGQKNPPFSKKHKAQQAKYVKAFIAGATSPEAAAYHGQGWVSVLERLPDAHIKEFGKSKINWVLGTAGRIPIVCVYTKGYELQFDDLDADDDRDELEEKNGCYYLKQGWYSLNETPGGEYDETWVPIKVTHWQPLPSPPQNTEP